MSESRPADFDSSRVVPLRARRDLQIAAADGGRWTVKDPVSLQYFRLSPQEYSVFSMLDGSTTFQQLIAAFRKQFPETSLSMEILNGFLIELLRSGLVTGPFVGLGHSIAQRQRTQQHSQRLAAWFNPLSVRVSGFDPEQMLRRCDGLIRRLLSPVALCGYLLVVLAAVLAVGVRLEVLTDRLPHMGMLLNPRHLLLCGFVFLLIKVLHEFAHAAVCRYFGGECHDMGVLLIVCIPLFYCDVTDAWMLASRWKRIAISAAGIGLELVLASVAGLLWWLSVPGPLHDLFLSVMLVCSINTLLFNGNPLLRYDGYYVLADLIDIPNLGAQARGVAWSTFDRVFLGDHPSVRSPVSSGRYWFLLGYAVASGVYRVIVVAAIGWFVLTIATQWEMKTVGLLLVTPLVLSVAIPFAQAALSRGRGFARQDARGKGRAVAGLLGFTILAGAVVWVPLPFSVESPFVIVPGDAAAIHVPVAGRLETSLPPGTPVERGESLASLANVMVTLEVEAVRTSVKKLAARVEHLQRTRALDDVASLQLPITTDALVAAKQRLRRLTERCNRLNVISPRAGTIIPARGIVPLSRTHRSFRSSHPIAAENRGAWLTERNLLCYVGDPSKRNANLIVDDTQIEHVRIGQSVTLMLQSAAGRPLRGRIQEIASVQTGDLPREVIVAGLLPGPNDVPSKSYWQVTVQIDEVSGPAVLFSPGRARIDCGQRSLASRIAETFRRTFAAEL